MRKRKIRLKERVHILMKSVTEREKELIKGDCGYKTRVHPVFHISYRLAFFRDL